MDAELLSQLSELNAGIADLAQASDTAEVRTILAEMLEVMKSRTERADAPAPVVNVSNEVHPAPVTVHVQRSGGFTHTFKYDEQGRLKSATSLPIQPKGN